jgi:hypothetical protein
LNRAGPRLERGDDVGQELGRDRSRARDHQAIARAHDVGAQAPRGRDEAPRAIDEALAGRRRTQLGAAPVEERYARPIPERLDAPAQDAPVHVQVARRLLERTAPPARDVREEDDVRLEVKEQVARVCIRHDA